MKRQTNVERKSDREVVVTRTFDCPASLVYEAWTRADLESGGSGPVTTVTFEERDGNTLLTLRELYTSKEALAAAGTGAADALNETFGQLDELLVALG